MKRLEPFVRGIRGIPFGERILPGSIFANLQQRGTSSTSYRIEARGEKWWYEQTTLITYPHNSDEVIRSWAGPYDSREECQEAVRRAQNLIRAAR